MSLDSWIVMMSAFRSFAVIFSSSSLLPIPFALSCSSVSVLFELRSLVGLTCGDSVGGCG